MAFVAALFLLTFVAFRLAYVVDETCDGKGFGCIFFADCPPNTSVPLPGCSGWKSCCGDPKLGECYYKGGVCKDNCSDSDIEQKYGRCTRNRTCCVPLAKSPRYF
uniref:Putative carboxypeptidase inhibitor n=1 Tax=Rhipicephalus microplus TaxID=6941 RepID=A0A6G5A9L3_RHIMP